MADNTGELAGRSVARVGFGAMQLERLHDTPDAAIALLEHAVGLGVNHIDTAQFYGNGFVNGVIRQAIPDDGSVVVATKVGATPDPGGPYPMRPAQRPEQLRADVEANLRALGRDTIPLVYLRRLDIGPGLAAHGDQVVPVDDQLAEMVAMRDEGMIGAIGLSAITHETLEKSLPAGIASVQNPYSILDRRFERSMQLCEQQGIGWVPFFPLGSAFPGIAKVTEAAEVIDAAAHADVAPAQVALAWLLVQSSRTLLIPGTADVAHLESNMAVSSLDLSETVIAQLDAIGKSTVDAPITPPGWPAAE